MAKLSSLDDLLVHELQDIYHAEGQILKALPKMIKAASSEELKVAFEEHRRQTEGQVERLNQVFKLLGLPAKGKKCEGMAGLLRGFHEAMRQGEDGAVVLDLEGTGVRHVALEAAYAAEPFSTCWCVYSPPSGLTSSMLSAFTTGAQNALPGLAQDPDWPRQLMETLDLLRDHILKEQDGVFPAALTTLGGADWDSVDAVRARAGSLLPAGPPVADAR